MSWLKEQTGSCVRLSLRRDMHGTPVDLMRILPASITKQVQYPKSPPASKPDIRRGEAEAHSAASEWNRAWGVLSFHAVPQDENVVAARIRTKIARVSASIPKPVPYNCSTYSAKRKSLSFELSPFITSDPDPCGNPCRLARALAPSRHMLISRTGHFGCSVISWDATRMGRSDRA